MKTILHKGMVWAVVLTFAACSTVPITGRRQLHLVSDSEVLSLSEQSYREYMATAKKSTNQAATQEVVRVGSRIAQAVETYMRNNGRANEIKNYSWELTWFRMLHPMLFVCPEGRS